MLAVIVQVNICFGLHDKKFYNIKYSCTSGCTELNVFLDI